MHFDPASPAIATGRTTVRTLALSPLVLTESAFMRAYSSGVLLMTRPPERKRPSIPGLAATWDADATHLDSGATPSSDTGSRALSTLLMIRLNHLQGVQPPNASLEAFKEALVVPLVKGPKNAFPGMITVGRTQNNDIVIESTMVSRFHGYFADTPHGPRFHDSGSATNGTWVRGVRMEPRSFVNLEDGVDLHFGADVKALFLGASGLYALMKSCHLGARCEP
jgi:hypothetical protein